jgi:hypothetical protein
MTLSKKGLTALMAEAKASFPGASASGLDDAVQEALRLAIERSGAASEGALIAAAKAALPNVFAAEVQRRRRGGAVHEPNEGRETDG